MSSPFPFLPIDHVYVGSAWRTVSVVAGPPIGSDHRPVVVELEQSRDHNPVSPRSGAGRYPGFIETILPGSRGGSPFGSASTCSMPEVTSPHTVY